MTSSAGALGRDRKGAIALMTAILAPILLGMGALIIDSGLWVIGSSRLQAAADAGAMAVGYLITTSNYKALNSATQLTTAQAVAAYEAQNAATKLIGTMTTPVTVSVTNYTAATVTVYSQATSYFAGVFNVAAPLLRATATITIKGGAVSCVAALKGSGLGIKLDNTGTLAAASCPIYSNGNIYLNTGSISATAISAAGTITQSNSGGNSWTPSYASASANTPNASADPMAGTATPTPGACNVTNGNYTSYGSTTFTPTGTPPVYTFCGNTTIGGNGSTQTFNTGTYYVVNGDLTFNNASITTPTTAQGGMSIVMTATGGNNPGNFSWTNYSNTSTPISATTSGPAAGVAIWQACNSGGGQTASFQGGSTLTVTGTIYMPCADVDAGNGTSVNAAINQAASFIAGSIYVHGSSTIRTSASSGGGGGSTAGPVLTQ